MAAMWVYGLWREETFAVLEGAWAIQADQELTAWRAVGTWGEARALVGRTNALGPPFDPEDYEDEVDDEPFELGELASVGDGDWPAMPAQGSLDLVPPEWELGEQVETVLNGPYLLITPDREADLLRLIEESGRTVRRDDALINRLGVWPDGI